MTKENYSFFKPDLSPDEKSQIVDAMENSIKKDTEAKQETSNLNPSVYDYDFNTSTENGAHTQEYMLKQAIIKLKQDLAVAETELALYANYQKHMSRMEEELAFVDNIDEENSINSKSAPEKFYIQDAISNSTMRLTELERELRLNSALVPSGKKYDIEKKIRSIKRTIETLSISPGSEKFFSDN